MKMEIFDGKHLFLIILLVIPFIGIQIKLFKTFLECEAVKDILGKDKFYWMLQQYDAKRKQQYKIETAFLDNVRLLKDKIKTFIVRIQIIKKAYRFVLKTVKIEE